MSNSSNKVFKMEPIEVPYIETVKPCPFCQEEYGIDRVRDCSHYDKVNNVYCG